MAHNKKNTFYLILISTLLLTSCGFKKLEKLNGNYNAQEVSIKGDRRVGYILKNEIMLNSSSKSKNLIIISISTDKKKLTKEKNIKNKTTKYEVKLSTNIKFTSTQSTKEIGKSFIRSFYYDVEKDHSLSLANEKNELDDLTSLLAEDIINYLNSYFN